MAEIRNGSCLYRVGKQVAETDNYRLYLCWDEKEQERLLQIATGVERNGGLQRAAYILKELERRACELEEDYARVKTDPKVVLNYQLGFPELVDTFICLEQGGRQINILAFRNVKDVAQMVPLSNITAKDRMRVDLRTSVWIMGKLLKLLAFAFGEGFSVDPIGNNILIEPEQHYVLIFDWSAVQTYSEVVPGEVQCLQISQAAQAIIVVLGGDLETSIFPDDSSKAYTDFIMRLARGGARNAEEARKEFYALVDAIWERKYHPFTVEQNENERKE